MIVVRKRGERGPSRRGRRRRPGAADLARCARSATPRSSPRSRSRSPPGRWSPTPSSTWSPARAASWRAALHLWDPIGGVRPAAEPGLRLPLADGAVLRRSATLVRLPPWVVQRLWWALLLCVAFFGIAPAGPQARPRHARRPRSLAAFAFVLTPADHHAPRRHRRSRSGRWRWRRGCCCRWCSPPSAGSLRRAAALSALVVATLRRRQRDRGRRGAAARRGLASLTRARGPRRWRLLGWWTLFTALATAWWWLPAAPARPLQRRRSSTTSRTPRSRRSRPTWPAPWWGSRTGSPTSPASTTRPGSSWSSTPFLMLDAAVVVALGLVGIALRDNPHRRFLTLGLLTGLVLVGFGYAGDLAGFFAADRAEALDGVAGAAAQPAQVRRGAAHPAGARAGARDGGAAEAAAQPGVARRQPRRGPRGARDGGAGAWSRWRCRGPRTGSRRARASSAVPAYWYQRRRLPRRPRRRHRRPRGARRRRSASTPGATPTTTCCRGWPRARGRCAT